MLQKRIPTCYPNYGTPTKGKSMSDTASAAPAATSDASTAPVDNMEATSEEIEDTGEDLADDGTEPQKDEAKKEAVSRKKKYQLKVNGKSRDFELDLDNDDEIQKYLSKAMAADEKFQEAAMTRKQAEQLVEMLRTNPLAILKHPDLGLDVKQLAQQVLNEELEEMSKTPEQKELEDMKSKLKEYEEEKKRLENDKREADKARIESEAFQQLDEQITSALTKSSLPRSDYTIKRIADMMIDAVNAGYVDVTVDQIMPLVEEKITAEIQALFETSPDEVFEKLVNKKRLDAYRKAKVSKAKSKPVVTAKQIQDSGASAKTQPKAPTAELRVKDLFKMR